MTTPITTTRPPSPPIGPVKWMQRNLFSSWWNSLLTLVTGWLLISLGLKTITWAVSEAKWEVVAVNLRLFMIGAYPDHAIWRIWVCVALVSLVSGVSWAVWGRWSRRVAAGVVGAGLLLALGPVSLETRLWWVGCAALVPLGYLLGSRVGLLKRWPVTLWVVTIPVVLLLVRGWHGSTLIPYVGTGSWNGLLLTIMLALLGIILSFPFGVLLALGRQSSLPAIRYVSIFYIEVVRGVPLISILFVGMYIVPVFLPPQIRPDIVLRALIGITMFSAAYLAENVRGGLQAIPRGQVEAAKALGLSGWKIVLLIVLPQALRAVIPTLVGQFIGLLKDTSLVSIVSLIDLMGVSKAILAQPAFLGRHIEVYVAAAAIYFVFSYFLSYGSRRLEKALGVGER